MSVSKAEAQKLLLFAALLVQKFHARYNLTQRLHLQGNGFQFWHKLNAIKYNTIQNYISNN
jgi:hypothetical protein